MYSKLSSLDAQGNTKEIDLREISNPPKVTQEGKVRRED